MRILGITAEYDPFHRGHERHLRLAREQVKPDFVVCALSGCFKQRGEPALLSPYDRAECALAAGADAVFALPAVWTVRNAENYALGAVSMLKRLGATHLAFGAETADPALLWKAARLLENPDEAFRASLKEKMARGMGYPQAVSLAAGERSPETAEAMARPNNILGVCYLRALLRLGAEMEIAVIPRGGDYRADRIQPEEPGASAVRSALERGDWGHALGALTDRSRETVQRAFLEGRVCRKEALDRLLIGRLRSMSREELRALPDVSEGLEDLLLRAAARAGSREELLDAVSGRRYPRARISRICACALLGMTREGTEKAPLPEKAVLLGLRRKPEMTALWRERKDLITSAFEAKEDLTAWRLWALCAGLPDSLPGTERVRSAGETDGP